MCYINVESVKKNKAVQILFRRIDIFKPICLSFMDICSWPITYPNKKKRSCLCFVARNYCERWNSESRDFLELLSSANLCTLPRNSQRQRQGKYEAFYCFFKQYSFLISSSIPLKLLFFFHIMLLKQTLLISPSCFV